MKNIYILYLISFKLRQVPAIILHNKFLKSRLKRIFYQNVFLETQKFSMTSASCSPFINVNCRASVVEQASQ